MEFCLKFSLAILFLCSLFSCASSETIEINKNFDEKYGKQVEKIRIDRTPAPQTKKELNYYRAPTEDEVAQEAVLKLDYFPYIDISQFDEKQRQPFMPNAEVYEQSRANNPEKTLPPNIFEVSYDTRLNPPFQRFGAEFDVIDVPSADVYGVKTEMSEKNYLLAGGDAMQRSVDTIEANRTKDDVEISEIIIREKKQMMRKNKMIKIFGENDAMKLALLEKEKTKKPQEKSKEKKSDKKPQLSANQQNSGVAPDLNEATAKN